MVDPQDAVLLYRASQEPKALWVVPQADHCGAYFENREEYINRIVTFFDRTLRGEPECSWRREIASFWLSEQERDPQSGLPLDHSR